MSKKLLYALNTTTPDAASPTIHYELTNHLGNVMAVITDEPAATETPAVESLTDYYPFGMTMPGRSYNAHTYRHGFTGHEKESDLAEGIYTTEYRLYDARVGRWLSVDPLFEKYVGMSPYNYCMLNPLVMVDPDGRKIDISGLTEEQAVIYNDNITAQREGSPLFNKLYTALENSEIVYPIKVGETLNDVDGQFNKKDNSITFSDINNSAETAVIAEELFHAYQLSENYGKYGDGSFNYEFEAKVFTTILGVMYGGYSPIDGMKDFQNKIMLGEFENKITLEPLDPQVVDSEDFVQLYTNAANLFGKYNKENNIGNKNYKTTTDVKPYSLIEIIK